MAQHFLLKSARETTLTVDWVSIPERARPQTLPEPGDTLLLWTNGLGLVESGRVTQRRASRLALDQVERLPSTVPPSWLDDADRLKTTIRSKLHCDRHDRLWRLSAAEMAELERAIQEMRR